MTKIDFLFTGTKGFEVLKNFISEFGAAAINTVVTEIDDEVLNDTYNEVVIFCRDQSIRFTPNNTYEATDNIFRFLIDWKHTLLSDGKTIVFHNSVLPKYRGFSPLINGLIKGEKEIGVSTYLQTEDYNEGPVIRQESVSINYPITIKEAIQLTIPLYSAVASFLYNQLQQKQSVSSVEQDHYLATYSIWRDDLDYHLNWNRPADEIKRKIDATGFPYKGATALLNGELIKIETAEIFGDVYIENREVGKVIFIKDNCPVVICGTGLIKITSAAFVEDGRSVMPFNNFYSRFS